MSKNHQKTGGRQADRQMGRKRGKAIRESCNCHAPNATDTHALTVCYHNTHYYDCHNLTVTSWAGGCRVAKQTKKRTANGQKKPRTAKRVGIFKGEG